MDGVAVAAALCITISRLITPAVVEEVDTTVPLVSVVR